MSTPSEDGRDDQPEVVAWMYPNPDGSLHMDAVRHKPDYPGIVGVMTVAQHERIVASKDAEIARLDAGWHEANKKVFELQETQSLVRQWAREKGIGGPEDVAKQVLKLNEEVGELGVEVILKDDEKAKMELGDCLVVCTIIAMKLGSNVEECLGMAYEKIKNRKGVTKNGVFIKKEEE